MTDNYSNLEENNVDRCEETVTHGDKVERANSLLPDDDMLFELSEFFKLFGDSTRIKILETLNGSELCVCDISAVVGVSQSGVAKTGWSRPQRWARKAITPSTMSTSAI